MIGLKLRYKCTTTGRLIKREYKTIKQFINEMESDNRDITINNCSNIKTIIQETRIKTFSNSNDLLCYCKGIIDKNLKIDF